MLELSILPPSPNLNILEGFPGIGPVQLSGIVRITNNRPTSRFASPKPTKVTKVEIEYFGVAEAENELALFTLKEEKVYSHTINIIDVPETNSSVEPIVLVCGDNGVNQHINSLQQPIQQTPITIFPDQTVDLHYQWILPQDVFKSLPYSVEVNKAPPALKQRGSVRYFCRATCVTNFPESGKNSLVSTFKSALLVIGKTPTASVSRAFRVIRYDRELLQKFLLHYQDVNHSLPWIPTDRSNEDTYLVPLGPEDGDTTPRVFSLPIMLNPDASASTRSLPETARPVLDDTSSPWSPRTPKTETNRSAIIIPGEPTPLLLPKNMTLDTPIGSPSTGFDTTQNNGNTTPTWSINTPRFNRNSRSSIPFTSSQLRPSQNLSNDVIDEQGEFSLLPDPELQATQSQSQQSSENPPTARGFRVMGDFSKTESFGSCWVGISSNVLVRGAKFMIYFRLNYVSDVASNEGKFKHMDVSLEEKQVLNFGFDNYGVSVDAVLSARSYEKRTGDFRKTSEIVFEVPDQFPKPFEEVQKEKTIYANRYGANLSWTNISNSPTLLPKSRIGQSHLGINPSGNSSSRIRISHNLRIKFVFTGNKIMELVVPVVILHPSLSEILHVAKNFPHLIWPDMVLADGSTTPGYRTRILEAIGENDLPAYGSSSSSPLTNNASRLPPPFVSRQLHPTTITVDRKDYL